MKRTRTPGVGRSKGNQGLLEAGTCLGRLEFFISVQTLFPQKAVEPEEGGDEYNGFQSLRFLFRSESKFLGADDKASGGPVRVGGIFHHCDLCLDVNHTQLRRCTLRDWKLFSG